MREDKDVRTCVWQSCCHDPRFYINTFCYTLDPRNEIPATPFITYDFQDAFLSLMQYNAKCSQSDKTRRWDLGVDKSRDMGISWTTLYFLDWVWRFDKNRTMRVISSKKERVDGTDDDDALFPKLDFNEERLPSSLSVRADNHEPDAGRLAMGIANRPKYNQIKGEASSADAGRGGRSYVAFRDEEASAKYGGDITKALNQTTRMQIRVSTPKGIDNSFYRAKTITNIDWMTFHWSLHPEKSIGLYSSERGVITIIDQEWHDAHPDYKCRNEATHADPGSPFEFLRSPWFDGECDGADSFQDIAQEIQISYLGTGNPFFQNDQLALLRVRNGQDPIAKGELLDFMPDKYLYEDEGKLQFKDRDARRDKAKLWFNPVPGKMVPQNTTYTMAADIASGNGGGSDSSLSIADDRTKEKVFEYRSNGITPEDFARLCVAIYRWFSTEGAPFFAWDQGGPGGPFGTKVMEYPELDVFYYKKKDELKAKSGRRPGMPSNREIKKSIFSHYRDELFYGEFITHSVESYNQAQQFVHDGHGGIVHNASQSAEEKSDTGIQHGDVTTSEVILVWAMKNRPEPMPIITEPQEGTLAYRIMQHELQEGETSRRWYNER